MKKNRKSKVLPVFLVLAVLLIAVIALAFFSRSEPPVDPHEGQVYINDGFGMVWMTPLEGVDVNDIAQGEIVKYNGVPKYVGDAYTTLRGVDVSEHQYEIDWKAVADSGVDFAYIRIGYRGYTKGGLFEDPYFKANIEGAKANGLKTGVYFFSQAITVTEAIEEAEYVVKLLGDYTVDLPIIYDWEKMEEAGADARTYQLDTDILDACAVAFCETIRGAGYRAGVYSYASWFYNSLNFANISKYNTWIAQYRDKLSFSYKYNIWQYTGSGRVNGISKPVDMNIG